MSLIGSLGKTNILNEANDDIFDIDKEVDAQIKRVQNRIEKKNAQEQQVPEENNINNQEQNNQNTEDIPDSPENEPVENQDEEIPDDQDGQNLDSDSQGEDNQDYNYIDNGQEDIPDDYEPKQTIPELKILRTLSDNEYQLSNIKILEQFRELKRNVDSFINNILMTMTTKNSRQRQIVNIVHKNMYEMLEDIDNYIIYRDNGIYEENSIAYLTYLKRFQIAIKIIEEVVKENVEKNENNK